MFIESWQDILLTGDKGCEWVAPELERTSDGPHVCELHRLGQPQESDPHEVDQPRFRTSMMTHVLWRLSH